jgi:hypothetical protein
MLEKVGLLLACAVLFPSVLVGQSPPAAPSPLIDMPTDRAAESYLIYSSLIPVGETAGKDWPHEFWLVQDATVSVVPPDQPCYQEPVGGRVTAFNSGMNPHNAVHPPENRSQDFQEILKDFDAHCHERLRLDSQSWKTTAPVHLLTPDEQEEFRMARFAEIKDSTAVTKFKGAPALYGFSQVYFNAHHTVALVYATQWCGGLCAQGIWFAFALEGGQWKQQKWNATNWIS